MLPEVWVFSTMKQMKIFSGSSNKPLAQKIAQILGIELSPIEIFIFPDGERRVRIMTPVVGEDTVIVQPTATPVDQNYMELFFIADSLKRSGARSITVVIPYLGYQRQDHVFRDGEAVSLEVIVNALESVKINRVIAFDFHTVKTPEIFSIPVSHLSALSLFAEKIKEMGVDNDSVLVSPDMGGLRRIKIISEILENIPWVATVKDRNLATGSIEIKKIEGELPNGTKKAFIVDDMTSSGETLIESAKLLRDNGIDEIYAFVTHAVFSEDAPKKLQESNIKKVYVTDSVFVSEEKMFSKLEILSIAEMIGKNIKSNI